MNNQYKYDWTPIQMQPLGTQFTPQPLPTGDFAKTLIEYGQKKRDDDLEYLKSRMGKPQPQEPTVNNYYNIVHNNLPYHSDNSKIIDRSWNFIKKWEGGYNPNDRGSPGNFGIRLANNEGSIPDYNNDGKIDAEDIRALTENDAKNIFINNYYNKAGLHNLSNPAFQLYAADTAFNQGVGGLQAILKAAFRDQDMATINGAFDSDALLKLHNARMQRYYGTPGYGEFGNGWTKRAIDAYRVANELLWR